MLMLSYKYNKLCATYHNNTHPNRSSVNHFILFYIILIRLWIFSSFNIVGEYGYIHGNGFKTWLNNPLVGS